MTSEFEFRNAYAVIIGIGDYKDPRIPKLGYARADAQAMCDLFVDPRRLGIPKDNIRLLLDADATLFNIKDAISGWLFRHADEESTAMVFFAGHGGLESDLRGLEKDGLAKYLLPWDAQLDNLFASALSCNDLESLLATIKSSRMAMFMDSCYAGGILDEKARDVQITEDPYARLATGSGRIVIGASKPNQRSFEDESLGHGIFAHHLLEALEGMADSDNDGLVTVTETFKYLEREVPKTARQLANAVQEPVMRSNITKDIVLTVNVERLAEIEEEKKQAEREAKAAADKDRLFRWRSDRKLTTIQYNQALKVYEADESTLSELDQEIKHLTLDLLAGDIEVENYAFTVDKFMEGVKTSPVPPPPQPAPRQVPPPPPPRLWYKETQGPRWSVGSYGCLRSGCGTGLAAGRHA